MPNISQLLSILGYEGNPSCLRPADHEFQTAPQVGHILRKAAEDLQLKAAFVIHPQPENLGKSLIAPIPAVFVCDAKNETEADEIHRKVWNQDVTPFVIVNSPTGIRLYSGFQHRISPKKHVEGQLSGFVTLDEAAKVLKDFNAQSISSGATWSKRPDDVHWQHRLNRQLLDNLVRLDSILQKGGLSQSVSHALIGKFVYLRYLRDRKILSDRKLTRWGIEPAAVFGRNAEIEAISEVNQKLDKWLNGSVFPVSFSGRNAPKPRDVQLVSGVFSGDQMTVNGDIQLALDFETYDFSYIPIETLSLVYEQFLHNGRKSEARSKGAYYTPIPVVNLMLSEMEESHPLRRGMTVIDPSCGSGAFLVQAYRRVIEREFPAGTKPKPGELRELLERTIFGVDVDEDACNVTELSLIMTLLDYLDPPDLEDRRRNFKLPTLRGKNIFCGNFFDPLPETLAKKVDQGGFDWVVGNPPWKQLTKKKLTTEDKPVWKWMGENAKEKPIGSNQVARAFVWKSAELLSRKSGKAALFIPSMTLYDNPSKSFRHRFFSQFDVSTIIDFSNMATVLSPGRFQAPAASIFFETPSPTDGSQNTNRPITFFAPKVANQEITRPPKSGKRIESWEIVINGSEIREVSAQRAATGDGTVWKFAMWGSYLDERFLRRLDKKFLSFGEREKAGEIVASEGVQLRRNSNSKDVTRVPEVIGENRINVKKLSGLRSIFTVPRVALEKIPEELGFIRKRGGRKGMAVNKPPHVIVSAARNFAIYSDDFIIVPPRQIGIVSPTQNNDFLKTISLFLSSDFALYHQFLESPQAGTKREVSTLKSLRKIPLPFSPDDDLSKWAELHQKLVDEQKNSNAPKNDLFEEDESLNFNSKTFLKLLDQLNTKVAKALGLSKREQALIHDLLKIRLGLNEGKVEDRAVRQPNHRELLTYAKTLKADLDDFVGRESKQSHEVTVLESDSQTSAVVVIEFCDRPHKQTSVNVEKTNSRVASQLGEIAKNLVLPRAQWVYFNRNFRIYDGKRTFCFKPMQRFHWTRTQAALDAQTLIAETLTKSAE